MIFLLWGINHHSAPIELREKVAKVAADPLLHQKLHAFLSSEVAGEPGFVVVTTCNRTEVYLLIPAVAAEVVLQRLHEFLALGIPGRYFFNSQGTAVIRHLFALVGGLDSMVLGEVQIAGQVKQAFALAGQAQRLPGQLQRLFQHAFSVAKKIRSHSDVGRGTVSFAAASVSLARRTFGELESSRVLLIGAGEMMRLTSRHFAGHTPLQLVMSNRNLKRAEELLHNLPPGLPQGEVLPWEEWPQRLGDFDIVVVCTAATSPIVSLEMVKAALARRGDPMVLIDLALPRNIDPTVATLNGIYLYSVDDVGRLTEQGKKGRAEALDKTRDLLEQEVLVWHRQQGQRLDFAVLEDLLSRTEMMGRRETQRALSRLKQGEDAELVMAELARRINAKWLDGYLAAHRQLLNGAAHGEPFLVKATQREKAGLLQHFLRTRRGSGGLPPSRQ